MPDETVPPNPEALAIQAQAQLNELLPDTVLSPDIPEHVRLRADQTQQALIVLGPAGGAVSVCPGNQINTPAGDRCPLFAKCDLARNNVAPQGQLCPFERSYVVQRFADWCKEFDRYPATLTETERVTVAELTWIDLQELRCSTILSSGKSARLTQTSVKEIHPETGALLAWEEMIHVNALLLDQLQTRRRMILKDWELTPEMKTRKAKVEGKGKGNDFSSQQSTRADKLRKMGPVLEG